MLLVGISLSWLSHSTRWLDSSKMTLVSLFVRIQAQWLSQRPHGRWDTGWSGLSERAVLRVADCYSTPQSKAFASGSDAAAPVPAIVGVFQAEGREDKLWKFTTSLFTIGQRWSHEVRKHGLWWGGLCSYKQQQERSPLLQAELTLSSPRAVQTRSLPSASNTASLFPASGPVWTA